MASSVHAKIGYMQGNERRGPTQALTSWMKICEYLNNGLGDSKIWFLRWRTPKRRGQHLKRPIVSGLLHCVHVHGTVPYGSGPICRKIIWPKRLQYAHIIRQGSCQRLSYEWVNPIFMMRKNPKNKTKILRFFYCHVLARWYFRSITHCKGFCNVEEGLDSSMWRKFNACDLSDYFLISYMQQEHFPGRVRD